MGWNHRVLATEHDGEVYLQIHEVLYDKDGIPDGHTVTAIKPGSEDIKGLRWTLNKMQECLKRPILWGDSRFPQEVKIIHTCLLCGRDKFQDKGGHQCRGGFRKRGLKWKTTYK